MFQFADEVQFVQTCVSSFQLDLVPELHSKMLQSRVIYNRQRKRLAGYVSDKRLIVH